MSNNLFALVFLSMSCACHGAGFGGYQPENNPALNLGDATRFGEGFALYDKIGFGKCPNVKPVSNFDMTDIYGKWYTIAHYNERFLYGKKCRVFEITSGDNNKLKVPCRLNLTYHYVDATTGKYETGDDGWFLIADENNQGNFVFKKMNGPTENFLVSAYSDTIMVLHACEEFPEDLPVAYYQHNFILARKPVLTEEEQNEIARSFASFQISMKPLVPVDHDNCEATANILDLGLHM